LLEITGGGSVGEYGPADFWVQYNDILTTLFYIFLFIYIYLFASDDKGSICSQHINTHIKYMQEVE